MGELFLSVEGESTGLHKVVTLTAGTVNVVTLTVRDRSGNPSSCQTRVTVVPDSGSMCGGTNAIEVGGSTSTGATTVNQKAGAKRIFDGDVSKGWSGSALPDDAENPEGLVDLRWDVSETPVLVCAVTIVGVEAADVLFVEVTDGNFKKTFGWDTLLELAI